MSRIKRVWWILLVLAGSFYFAVDGYCFVVDPYYYNILRGSIYFEYQKTDNHYLLQPADQRTSFQQRYDLSMTGRIISSRIATFNAKLNLRRDDVTSSANGNGTTRVVDYGLHTTLLPKSAIPLTLYGERTENKSTHTSTIPSTDITTNYGLNWFGKFRTLPATNVTVDKTNTKGANYNTEQTRYTVDATKDVANTQNHLFYNGSTNDDRLRHTSATSDSINFSNTTKISRDTVIGLGAATSRSLDPDSGPSSAEAYSMSLNSRPSQEFQQGHAYSTYSTKTKDNRNLGTTYNGSLSYAFSDRLTSVYRLNIFDISSSSATVTSKGETVDSAASIKYALAKRWSASENVTYQKTTASSKSGGATNLSGREMFSEYTNLNYARPGEWVSMTAGYGAGYAEDHLSDGRGGSGGSDVLSLSASKGRHELDYVNLSSMLSYSRSRSFTSIQDKSHTSTHLWNESASVKLEASNKIWRRYLEVIGSIDKDSSKSWTVVSDKKTEAYRLDVGTDFIRNTRAKAYASHQIQFGLISGSATIDSRAWDISHSRPLLGGIAGLGYNYSFTNSVYSGGSSTYEASSYNANYMRGFPGNTLWRATLSWSSTLSDNVTNVRESVTNAIATPFLASMLMLSHKYEIAKSPFSTATTNEGKLGYVLRSWFISAEDTYSVIDQTGGKSTSNILIVRVSRGFATIL